MAYEELAGEKVRAMKDEELGLLVQGLRDKQFKLRTQRVSEKVEDNSQFKKIRRDIARLKTEQAARAQG